MPKYKAVVVGINDYPPPNFLPSCLNDARAFGSLLASAGFEVKAVLNTDATVANVDGALKNWLFADAKPDDRLVFYYSGHGYTERRGNVMEEFLVFMDGLYQDDTLSAATQFLPPGTLTIVLDSCFSGGMEKAWVPPGARTVEIAKIKAYQPTDTDMTRMKLLPRGVGAPAAPAPGGAAAPAPADKGFEPGQTVTFKKFGLTAAATKEVVLRAAQAGSPTDAAGKALSKQPGSDEVGQTQTKGLLVAACLETETAAASTSMTDGKSAFTYALLSAIDQIGRQSTNVVFQKAAQILRDLNFRQTPLVIAPPAPSGLADRTFLTLEASGAPAVTPPFGTLTPVSPPAQPQSSAGGGLDPQLLSALLAALVPALVNSAKAMQQPAPQPPRKRWSDPRGYATGETNGGSNKAFFPPNMFTDVTDFTHDWDRLIPVLIPPLVAAAKAAR